MPKPLLAEATRVHMQGYGFGFGINAPGSPRRFGHTGGAPGMNAALYIYPDLEVVVVSLSNLDPPWASRLADFLDARIS